MDRRTWVIAVLIVGGAIAFLAWDPSPPTQTAPPPAAANAPIATLGEAAPPPIATVTLAPAERGAADPAAALLARFEAESVDAVWAARATSRIEALFDDLPVEVTGIACRRTACRVTMQLADGTDPAAGVAGVLEGLAAEGIPALLQRADGGRIDLVVAP